MILEDKHRQFLREKPGFDFLLFRLRKQSRQAGDSANIDSPNAGRASRKSLGRWNLAYLRCSTRRLPRSVSTQSQKFRIGSGQQSTIRTQDLRSQPESFLAEATPSNENSRPILNSTQKSGQRVEVVEENLLLGHLTPKRSTPKFQSNHRLAERQQTQSLFRIMPECPSAGDLWLTPEIAGVYGGLAQTIRGKCHGAAMRFELADFED